MEELIGIAVQVAIFGGLLLLGLFAGGHAERKHLRALEAREAALAGMLVTDLRSFPGGAGSSPPPAMVVGEVSIACDYLKAFLAALRNLIGGEVRAFETLQLRARREATLRAMEQAHARGFNALANLRLETADIAGSITTNQKRKMVVVSVIAYATAYVRDV